MIDSLKQQMAEAERQLMAEAEWQLWSPFCERGPSVESLRAALAALVDGLVQGSLTPGAWETACVLSGRSHVCYGSAVDVSDDLSAVLARGRR